MAGTRQFCRLHMRFIGRARRLLLRSCRTEEVLKDVLIAGAVGAGVGAAGGAIAGGGKGEGKGAGIDGLVGATAGTLYGIHEANKADDRTTAAYQACLRTRGYTG